jgi:hypothetical protein
LVVSYLAIEQAAQSEVSKNRDSSDACLGEPYHDRFLLWLTSRQLCVFLLSIQTRLAAVS